MSKVDINRTRIEIIDDVCDETDYADVRSSIEDAFDAGVRWARKRIDATLKMDQSASSLSLDGREAAVIGGVRKRIRSICPLCLGDGRFCRNDLVKLVTTVDCRSGCNCHYDCCVACHAPASEIEADPA